MIVPLIILGVAATYATNQIHLYNSGISERFITFIAVYLAAAVASLLIGILLAVLTGWMASPVTLPTGFLLGTIFAACRLFLAEY